jgi:hypothetical protein
MTHAQCRSIGRWVALAALSLALAAVAAADLQLGPEDFAESGGVDIDVPGYSVPSTADWNDDGLLDLIVGEGGAEGKVRVYTNIGTASAPAFDGYAYAQAGTTDLVEPGAGCLGVFPRVVYWDADGKKDLITGRSDGTIRLYTNTNTDAAPIFDTGTFLQVGAPGSKIDIDVGSRATPVVVDWNQDGRKDLVVGQLGGKLFVYLNEGTDTEPDFLTYFAVQDSVGDLVVPTSRSSPHVVDLDHDGKKDVLSGNTYGQLVFYSNVGTNEAPTFSGYTLIEADSIVIDLPGTSRSRPFVCEWNRDGFMDVLIGYGDGLVRVYTGIEHYHHSGAPEFASLPSAVLLAPRPNPALGRSVVAFELPFEQSVRLTVYDVSGRRVARLADRDFGPGRHEVEWSGVDERGRTLPSGIYFVRMESPGSVQTTRLVLLR